MIKKTTAFLLCLILACLTLGAPAETPEKSEPPFATVGDAATDRAMIYSSADYYVVLVEKDGAWWRVDAQVDEQYSFLYSASMQAEDPAAAYEKTVAYACALPVASAEKLSEQPLSADILKSYTGKKMKDLLADGFGFDWAQGFTADESKDTGSVQVLRPSDAGGNSYRIRFNLFYIGPGYADGLLFFMSKGIYSYQFHFSGTEETLMKAIDDGSWEEMEITDEPFFSGFCSDMEPNLRPDRYGPKYPTNEEASAIRTVHDAQKYDFIGLYSENGDEYILLINGTDSFWVATAELDDRYRELSRAAAGADEKAANELQNYESALPVTVKALNAVHPPIHDLSACVGKTVSELQAEGFRITWIYATTQDPEKEEYNRTFNLPGFDGEEIIANGFISYNDYDDLLMMEAENGFYEYTFTFDGNAETLQTAIDNGTFLDLTVRETVYSGMSSYALISLGLD